MLSYKAMFSISIILAVFNDRCVAEFFDQEGCS